MKTIKTHIGAYETKQGWKYQVRLRKYNKTFDTLKEAEEDLHEHIINAKVSNHSYPYDLVSLLFKDDIPSIEWVEIHFHNNLLYVMQTLTQREQEIFSLRDIHGYTLEAVAERLNRTRERIRQIESKAIRKLRHPYRMKILQRGKELSEWEKEVNELEAKLIKKKDDLIYQLNHPEEIVIDIKDDYDSKELYKLDLSVRTYNCLRRGGYKTLGDLRDVSYEDLMKVRNLGKKSLKEIETMLKEYGIKIKGFWRN